MLAATWKFLSMRLRVHSLPIRGYKRICAAPLLRGIGLPVLETAAASGGLPGPARAFRGLLDPEAAGEGLGGWASFCVTIIRFLGFSRVQWGSPGTPWDPLQFRWDPWKSLPMGSLTFRASRTPRSGRGISQHFTHLYLIANNSRLIDCINLLIHRIRQ